jgi:pimeloyl-ACP methyl ester carboxylesterase
MSPPAPTESPETLIFLPGASGNRELWKPIADGLSHPGPRRFFGWPGFGGLPEDPSVTGLGDLVSRVVDAMTGPVVLFAQSMGGVIALRAALQAPDQVRSIVLSVTSGGIDVRSLGAVDWRPDFLAANPGTPRWFLDENDDLTPRLREIAVPVLLLWGDADPISPVPVGERLAELLLDAELLVIPDGTHDLASERASEVLPHIERHLAKPPLASARSATTSMSRRRVLERMELFSSAPRTTCPDCNAPLSKIQPRSLRLVEHQIFRCRPGRHPRVFEARCGGCGRVLVLMRRGSGELELAGSDQNGLIAYIRVLDRQSARDPDRDD